VHVSDRVLGRAIQARSPFGDRRDLPECPRQFVELIEQFGGRVEHADLVCRHQGTTVKRVVPDPLDQLGTGGTFAVVDAGM